MSRRAEDPTAAHDAFLSLVRGDIDAARTAVEDAPDYASSWIVRAEVGRADGRLEDARDAARRAVRLAPNSPRALLLLEAVGAETATEPTFADLIDEDPVEVAPIAPPRLPSASDETATQPSVATAESADSDVPNLVSETLAELLIKQGKRAEARKVYIQLARLHPERYAYFRSRMDELAPNDR